MSNTKHNVNTEHIQLNKKNTLGKFLSRLKVGVRFHLNVIISMVHHNTYFHQVASIYVQLFFFHFFCGHRHACTQQTPLQTIRDLPTWLAPDAQVIGRNITKTNKPMSRRNQKNSPMIGGVTSVSGG